MGNLTQKGMYQMVVDEILKRMSTDNSKGYSTQMSTGGGDSTNVQIAATDNIITEVRDLLFASLTGKILTGLHVSAENDTQIRIEAGTGSIVDKLYALDSDVILTVPFTWSNVLYVNLYLDTISIKTNPVDNELTIATIIVPDTTATARIQDDVDQYNPLDAYILNRRVLTLYVDKYDKFEDDSLEILRDNIGDILADNLIGNLRLSENLKIINTQGTLELNSDSMLLKNVGGTTLAKFNRYGTYYYNDSGVEVAKFATDEARLGNMLITANTMQSQDFVSGSLGKGFQIQDNGDAEFNSITVRGKLTASVFEKDTISAVGGSLLVMDADTLSVDMTTSETSTLTIAGDTTFSVGDILRIKDGVEDEWLEVTGTGSGANTYTVTRDKGDNYASGATLPAWTTGTTVVNYGVSGEGGIFLSASEANSPYVSILTHDGAPWSSINTHLKLGNLNGFLDYTTDEYGIGIGTTDDYLKYDPTNGLRIKGDITITGGNATVTFYQATEPGSSGEGSTPKNGDYWIDTDDDNKLYVYDSGAWTLLSSSGATTFRQSQSVDGIPTALAAGDLFLDTDSARLYRATNAGDNQITSGEWEPQQTSVATPPGAGLYLGSDYMGYYSGATWQSFIKNDGTFQFQGDGSNYVAWNGVTLTVRGALVADDITTGTLSSITIDSNTLTSNTITSGTISSNTLTSNSITSGTITGNTITGNTIKTATTGARIEMSDQSFIAYDDSSSPGNEVFKVQLLGAPSGGAVGDVTIGDINNANYVQWDNSTATLNVRGALSADDLTVGTLASSRIAATSITADKLNVSTLSAISADMGTISAGTITGATIRTAASGARINIDTTRLIAYDDAATQVFEVVVSGVDVGDVILGDPGTAYVKWDKSVATLVVSDMQSADYVASITGFKLSSSSGLEINTGVIKGSAITDAFGTTLFSLSNIKSAYGLGSFFGGLGIPLNTWTTMNQFYIDVPTYCSTLTLKSYLVVNSGIGTMSIRFKVSSTTSSSQGLSTTGWWGDIVMNAPPTGSALLVEVQGHRNNSTGSALIGSLNMLAGY